MTGADGGRLTRRGLLGAGGAVALGAGGATAQEGGDGGTGSTTVRPDFGSWLTHQGEPVAGGFEDARGQSSVTVEVGASGNGGTFAFAPASLWIDPGTEVTFEWTSNTHNVRVESRPDGAGWEPHESIEDEGFSYSTTFETGGLHEYYCEPHLPLGMKGGIAVGDDVPTREVTPPGSGDGGDGGYTLPGSALGQTMLAVLWATVGVGALAVLGAEYYRRRRDRSDSAPAIEEPSTEGPATEAPEPEPANPIDHDEYDPWGTALLIAAYLLVLVVMWVFVYFVEFLGNGPTVVG